MTECVILWRNPKSGSVEYICERTVNLKVFTDRDEAIRFAAANTLLQTVPYQIVELTEL